MDLWKLGRGTHWGFSRLWDLPTCQTDPFSFDLFKLKISYIVSATIAKQNSLLKKGKHWAGKDYLSERAIVIIVSCICPKHVLIRCRHAWTWNWKEECERNGKEENVRRCANRADLLEHVRRHSTVNFATSYHETIFLDQVLLLKRRFTEQQFQPALFWKSVPVICLYIYLWYLLLNTQMWQIEMVLCLTRYLTQLVCEVQCCAVMCLNMHLCYLLNLCLQMGRQGLKDKC